MRDFIYCQNNIPEEQWRYGLRSSAATGCGWIATYNALRIMGYRAKPERLIKYFEHMLPFVHGNAGTFLLAPAMFFRRQGFPVEISRNRKRFDEIAQRSDACILYFWWRKGFKIGAHFAAMHHTDKGYVGYNTYRSSTGPDHYGKNLEAFLKKRGYFGTMLIGIKDKNK